MPALPVAPQKAQALICGRFQSLLRVCVDIVTHNCCVPAAITYRLLRASAACICNWTSVADRPKIVGRGHWL